MGKRLNDLPPPIRKAH